MITRQEQDFRNTPASPQRPVYGYRPARLDAPPCVTIVTPFFNTGEVFEETARSVIGQSFQQWVWLIVNDGSTDWLSLTVLNRYRNRDPRIRVLDHPKNIGPGAARNTGFAAARTPFVVQLDSDDLLEPTAVEKWLWFLESFPECSFVKGRTVNFGAEQFLSDRGFEDGSLFLERNVVTLTGMIRKSVFQAVGGYDASLTTGLEDWHFWLQCANTGHWGGTIPEYLDWYRRRPGHTSRWGAWNARGMRAFRERAKQAFPRLWSRGGFPAQGLREPGAFETVKNPIPWRNPLEKTKPRILFLVPWMVTGGADKVNLDWMDQLTRSGWEVSVCATLRARHEWISRFAAVTPDVFVLPHFLRLPAIPRFLRYLIGSRQIDVVMINNCTLGYQLLPYLRAACPEVAFVDLNHVEEPHWLNGGHARFGVGYQDQLDLNIVTTAAMRAWMVSRGAEPDRVRVCYSGVDAAPVGALRTRHERVRRALGIDVAVPLLVFAGRLTAQKRPELLARILGRLAAENRAFRCFVVGGGPLLPALRRLVRHHGAGDRVRFFGSVPHARWLEILAASDVFLLPSAYEGISVALYEAMAMGVVPVVSEVGGHPELVSEDCGVLVRAGADEVDRYAAALASLLDSPARRQAMGDACRRRVSERFTHEATTRELLAALSEARSLSASAPRQRVGERLATELATLAVEYSRITAPEERRSLPGRLFAHARRFRAGRMLLGFYPVRVIGKWWLARRGEGA